MNDKIRILTLFVSFVGILLSCELANEQSESYFNATDSHMAGRNCMECHVSGESGQGWFSVAGTVYDSGRQNPYVNPVISLTTQPNGGGQEVLRLEGDARGNFYTTRLVDMRGGLYVSIIDYTGNAKHMKKPINDGACNRCHGENGRRLWLN